MRRTTAKLFAGGTTPVPPESQFTSQTIACYDVVATTNHQIIQKTALDLVSRGSGLIACIAPTGYGKSILAAQASELSCFPVVRQIDFLEHFWLSEICDELAAGPRSLLVLDDANSETLERLGKATIGEGHCVLCLGRSMAHPLLGTESTQIIGQADLKFEFDQIQELATLINGTPIPESVAKRLAETGWPEQVARVLAKLSEQDYSISAAEGLVDSGCHLDPLLDRCLSGLSGSHLDGLAQLAHLERFSEIAADSFAPGLIQATRTAGFPLLGGGEGALGMPTSLRRRLCTGTVFTTESAEILAPLLVATIGTTATLKALVSVGATKQAAAVVCAVSQDHLAVTDQTEMLGILRAIEAAEPEEPRVTLRRAGIHRNLAQLGAEREAVQAALQRSQSLSRDEVALIAEIELLRIDLRRIDPDEASDRLVELEAASLRFDERRIGIAIRELRTMILAQKSDLHSIYRSIELFKELASEWEHLGDRLRSAWLLRMLAAGPLNHIGHYAEGCKVLDRATPLVRENVLARAATAELLCRFLALAAESDRLPTEMVRAHEFTDEVGLRWMAGYLDWATLLTCLWQRDPDEAERSFRKALSKIGELAESETGTVFFAEAASVFAVQGLEELAEECLAKAVAAGTAGLETNISEIVFHARCGNASQVNPLIGKLMSSGAMPNERVWRLELEQLIANDRLGISDAQRAATLERIERAGHELGLTGLVQVLLADVKSQDETGGSAPTENQVHIALMGEFTVEVGGEDLTLPPGHISQLLKILATRGEALPVEYVVDRLWPDADPRIGKRRLKNVTSRLRGLTEIPIIARSGERIWLEDNVRTDLAQFRESARIAVRPSEGSSRLIACVDALNLYRGHLLPTELYDDEFSRERAALRAVALSVLDVALSYSQQRTVEPAWVLQVALCVEPDSESLFLEIAEAADAIGAHECAKAAHSQAQALIESLDLKS